MTARAACLAQGKQQRCFRFVLTTDTASGHIHFVDLLRYSRAQELALLLDRAFHATGRAEVFFYIELSFTYLALSIPALAELRVTHHSRALVLVISFQRRVALDTIGPETFFIFVTCMSGWKLRFRMRWALACVSGKMTNHAVIIPAELASDIRQ